MKRLSYILITLLLSTIAYGQEYAITEVEGLDSLVLQITENDTFYLARMQRSPDV